MSTPKQQTNSQSLITVFALLFALTPLIWPGLWGTSSDILGKRIVIYACVGLICILWFAASNHAKSSALILPASLYVFWNLLSLTWATNPFTGWVEGLQLAVMLTVFLAFIFCNITLHLTTIAKAVATSGFVVSIIGIAQYLGIGFESILSVGMPSSTFIFRNLAAAYLLGALPLALFAFLSEKNKMAALFWFLSLSTMVLFLFYTRTRGAWVSFAGALSIAVLLIFIFSSLRQNLLKSIKHHWSTPLTRAGMIICLLLLVVGATRPAQTSSAVIQQFDEKKSSPTAAVTTLLAPGSDRGRLNMWGHTISIFFDHPILGVGLDNWEYIYPAYDKGDQITTDSEPVRPHNDILWIASELGLIGLGLYLYMLLQAVILGFKQIKQTELELSSLIALLGLVALVGYSLFSFPKEQPTPALFFWLFLAILATPHQKSSSAPKILPILGLAICLCALYITSRQITFDISFNRALNYEKYQRLPQAYTEITKAINAGSFDHRAHFLKAKYLQDMGRHTEASKAYLDALEVHPNYSHNHHNLGGAYAAQKKYAEAIKSYQQAIALRPSYYQARLHLGNAYSAINQPDLAIKAFMGAIKINPNFAEAHTNLGALYLRKGELPLAIEAFREAIRLQPTNAQAHNNLAYSYEQMGDIPLAIAAYENVLKYLKSDPAYLETIRKHIQTLRNSN